MNTEQRTELSLIEAQLFASTDLAVITEIDASEDFPDALARLERLGMSSTEAAAVLEMPLRARTRDERASLLTRAQRLRDLLET